ncbi:uncharacterized protein LOC119692354 [Plutella xylostella]|uniref:uncharacterized protein LOC119692354 n=1 Tax=Plutella xylostella TaxID=51655 RepID=UPI002032B551|nr:uncharacterized protein LOC119692354 [Plutella xylostella]
MTRDLESITKDMFQLQKDKEWDPLFKIIILIESKVNNTGLHRLFECFMEIHIINVVVVDETDYSMYTYNPFENYGCGKKFDNIIKLGNCQNPHAELFPDKLVTDLRNCTFKILTTDYPPYAVDSRNKAVQSYGAEHCTLNTLADIGQFRINYSYKNIVDEFSIVTEDNVAKGPLKYLQDNKFDVVSSGMFLIEPRARAFSYVYGHMAYEDDMRIVVAVAGEVPKWKKVYMEFQEFVWIMLALAFVAYSIVVLVLTKKRYTLQYSVILKLWDNCFLKAGSNIQCSFPVRCVLILWLWFTFLVNSYYTTSLVSLITTEVNEYQVKTKHDLKYSF